MMTTSHLKENNPSSNPGNNITNSTGTNPSTSSTNPVTTILHNQQSYNIKHPLQYPWRFSIKLGKILGSSSKENWENAVQEATLFDTIEDFWCLYNNHVRSVDGMPEGSDYFFFKATVQPQWEDVQNAGQISLNITSNSGGGGDRGERGGSNRRIDPALIDKVILYIWLSLIGCQLENHQDINGFVFSKRARGDRFQLWIKSSLSSVHENIRSNIKSILSQQCNVENISFSSFENFENKRQGPSSSSGGGGGHSTSGASGSNIHGSSSGGGSTSLGSHHHSSYSHKSSSRNNSIDEERGDDGGVNHRHNINSNAVSSGHHSNRMGSSGVTVGDTHNPHRGKEGGFNRVNTTRRH